MPAPDEEIRNALLAKLLSLVLGDESNVGAYHALVEQYPATALLCAYEAARSMPSTMIRRSRGALFTHMLKNLYWRRRPMRLLKRMGAPAIIVTALAGVLAFLRAGDAAAAEGAGCSVASQQHKLVGEEPEVDLRKQEVSAAAIKAHLLKHVPAVEGSEHARKSITICNAIVTEPLDLSNLRLAGTVRLTGCTFSAGLDLTAASVKGSFSLAGSQIRGSLSMNYLRVEGTFDGRRLQVIGRGKGEVLEARHAFFGGIATFDRAEIRLPLFFHRATFVGAFEAQGAAFAEAVNLGGIRAQDNVLLAGAEFGAELSLLRAKLDRDLSLKGHVRSPASNSAAPARSRGALTMTGAVVDGYVYLGNRVFERTVGISFAKVGAELHAPRTTFLGDVEAAGVSLTGKALFAGASFGRGLILRSGQLGGDLDLTGVRWRALQATSVSRDSTAARLDLTRLRVGGEIRTNTMTAFSGTLLLAGLIHQGFGDWRSETGIEQVIAILRRAQFAADAYSGLETFLKSQGYTESADRVYIAQRRHERVVLRNHGAHLSFLSNWLQDQLVRFGRKPSISLIWGLLFVMFGAFVFKDRYLLRAQKPDANEVPFISWWYSTGMFIPVLDGIMSGFWLPKRSYRVGWYYLFVHRLLGWIIVPLGVAALSGLVK